MQNSRVAISASSRYSNDDGNNHDGNSRHPSPKQRTLEEEEKPS